MVKWENGEKLLIDASQCLENETIDIFIDDSGGWQITITGPRQVAYNRRLIDKVYQKTIVAIAYVPKSGARSEGAGMLRLIEPAYFVENRAPATTTLIVEGERDGMPATLTEDAESF